jgi:uncharacterized protein
MRKLLLVFVLLAACVAVTAAVDFTELKPQGYISDFAGVLQPGSREILERYCAHVEALSGVQIAVVIVDSLNGEPIEDVANGIFRRWGVGKKGKDEGILLLLAVRDRHMRLEVGYGLEPVIPDGFAGSVLRSMAPFLRQQKYADAVAEGLRLVGSRIAQAKGINLNAPEPHTTHTPPEEPIPWALFLGGLIVLFWAVTALGARRRGGSGLDFLAGMIAGNIIGRSLGPRGGGGFGGYDSGGGFGGFGGGDSGGGGASGSW